MPEYELLRRSCIILKHRLNNIKSIITNEYDDKELDDTNVLKIQLDGEDQTIGGVINYFLQSNKNIAYSGESNPNMFKDEVNITIASIKPNPIKTFNLVIDEIIEVYDDIEKQIVKLSKS